MDCAFARTRIYRGDPRCPWVIPVDVHAEQRYHTPPELLFRLWRSTSFQLLLFPNLWCRPIMVKDVILAEWTVMMAPFDPEIQTIGVINVATL